MNRFSVIASAGGFSLGLALFAPEVRSQQNNYPPEQTGLWSFGMTVNQDFVDPSQYVIIAKAYSGVSGSSPSAVQYSWFNRSNMQNACGAGTTFSVADPWGYPPIWGMSRPVVTTSGWIFFAMQFNESNCAPYNWSACDWQLYGIPPQNGAGVCQAHWTPNIVNWHWFPLNYGNAHHPGSAPAAVTIPTGNPGAGRTYVFVTEENPTFGDAGDIVYAYTNPNGTWTTLSDPGGGLAGLYTNFYIFGAPSVVYAAGKIWVAVMSITSDAFYFKGGTVDGTTGAVTWDVPWQYQNIYDSNNSIMAVRTAVQLGVRVVSNVLGTRTYIDAFAGSTTWNGTGYDLLRATSVFPPTIQSFSNFASVQCCEDALPGVGNLGHAATTDPLIVLQPLSGASFRYYMLSTLPSPAWYSTSF